MNTTLAIIIGAIIGVAIIIGVVLYLFKRYDNRHKGKRANHPDYN